MCPLRVAAIGPRRALLEDSETAPYFAAPHGDMMLAGCFGLLRSWAEKDGAVKEVVEVGKKSKKLKRPKK